MTADGTTKLTTDAVKFLPAKLRKRWRGQNVYYLASADTLVVKKTRPVKQTYAEAVADFRRLGKTITRADLRRAIAWARKQR